MLKINNIDIFLVPIELIYLSNVIVRSSLEFNVLCSNAVYYFIRGIMEFLH